MISFDLNLGTFALLLTLSVYQQQFEHFKALIQAIAHQVPDKDAKWIFSTVRRSIGDSRQAWFESAIERVRSGYDE